MKLTRLVPAAIAAVALLAGCSPTAGTALVVHGTRYTETDVTQIVDGCAEALGVESGQLLRQGVVFTLLQGGLFDSFGGDIDDAGVRALGAQSVPNSEQLFSVNECHPLALANVKSGLIQQVDPSFVYEAAENLEVKLNPRYGKWEPGTQHLITPSGSLSEMAPTDQ